MYTDVDELQRLETSSTSAIAEPRNDRVERRDDVIRVGYGADDEFDKEKTHVLLSLPYSMLSSEDNYYRLNDRLIEKRGVGHNIGWVRLPRWHGLYPFYQYHSEIDCAYSNDDYAPDLNTFFYSSIIPDIHTQLIFNTGNEDNYRRYEKESLSDHNFYEEDEKRSNNILFNKAFFTRLLNYEKRRKQDVTIDFETVFNFPPLDERMVDIEIIKREEGRFNPTGKPLSDEDLWGE